jgi:hypothetical protein
MLSIALVMAWEYWRKALWRTIAGLLIGGAVLVLMPFHGALPAQLVTSGSFSLVMILIAVIGVTTIELTEYDTRRDRLAFPQHLYTKPIPTSLMVGLRMLLTITTAVAIYLGLDLLSWLMSGASLRLLEPVLFLAVIAAWTDAALWSLSGSPLLQLIGLAIGYILCVSLYAEHVLAFDASAPSVYYILSMIPVAGLACAVAVVGVASDRRGARLSLARVTAWIGNWIYALRHKDRPFRSPIAAQFWLEWHRVGPVLPGLNLLVIAIYAGLAILTKEVSLSDGLAFLWGLAFVNICFFPILVAIAVNTRDRRDSRDLVWATRPLSDNALLCVRLRVAITSLLAGWGVWLAGLIAVSGLIWATHQPEGVAAYVRNAMGEDPDHLARWWFLYIGGLAVVEWMTLGIVGSLHATGRKPVAAIWIGVPVAFALWNVLVGKGILPVDLAVAVASRLLRGIPLLCLLATIAAYAAALRMNRITPRFGCICLGLYLILVVLVVLLSIGFGTAPTDRVLMSAIGLCALPLLPLALGPLAIAWNRHR